MMRCPGQDTRYWRPEDVSEVECARCGEMVEFFATEGRRRCPGCGSRVVNPAVSLGCAQWCKYAEQCMGFAPPSLAPGSEEETQAERLIEALKATFSDDRRRIAHALRVLDHAEGIMAREGGEPRVVIAAAILHDIGIAESLRKHGSSAPCHQEREGPAVARRIMEELGFEEDAIRRVCSIVATHHSGTADETAEFRVVWDADRLVNIEEGEIAPQDAEAARALIADTFKTPTGRARAIALLLGDEAAPGL